jgi:hypothetical protein
MENARVASVTRDVICCEHQRKTRCATTQAPGTALPLGFTVDKKYVQGIVQWSIEMKRCTGWFSHMKKAHPASDLQQLSYTLVFLELAP